MFNAKRITLTIILSLAGMLFLTHPAYPALLKSSPKKIVIDRIELAGIKEDVAHLRQQVAMLNLELERLSRENRELRTLLRTSLEDQKNSLSQFATAVEMNNRLADLSQELNARLDAEKSHIIREVSNQMERLAHQTQNAMKALADSVAAKPQINIPQSFSGDYPKEGVAYTVESGDTLSAIAKKFHSTVADIQNANKIANPKELKAGQTIFVPQSRN